MSKSSFLTTATQAEIKAAAPATVNVTNKPELREALKRIGELKATERAGEAAKRERKALEESLIFPALEAANAETFTLRGNVIAKLSSERTTHLYDYDMLAKTFPEAYEAVHSVSKYRFLQVL